MNDLLVLFNERLDEINTYLDLLDGIEEIVRSGVPRLGDEGLAISAQQQRILNSGTYLQLYNLIEATVTNCFNEVSCISMRQGQWMPGDLTEELRKQWARGLARTHVVMNPDKRLEETIKLCDHLLDALPVSEFEIDKGGGGNWDDTAIVKMATRIGFDLRLSKKANKGVKIKFKNDLGAMAFVVKLRNDLAHGSISFAECGQNNTAKELRALTNSVAIYMQEVVEAFISYIQEHRFLRPECRPQ